MLEEFARNQREKDDEMTKQAVTTRTSKRVASKRATASASGSQQSQIPPQHLAPAAQKRKAPRDPNAPKRKRGRPRKYDIDKVTAKVTTKVQPLESAQTQHLQEQQYYLQQQQRQRQMQQHYQQQPHYQQQQQQQFMQQQYPPLPSHVFPPNPQMHASAHQAAMQQYELQGQLPLEYPPTMPRQGDPSNFVSDYFKFSAQSLRALEGTGRGLVPPPSYLPQHQHQHPVGSHVSVIASSSNPPPNHLAGEDDGQLNFLSHSAPVVSSESIQLHNDHLQQQQQQQQNIVANESQTTPTLTPAVISKTEGIKYDSYVASPTLPPPHIGNPSGLQPSAAAATQNLNAEVVSGDNPGAPPAVAAGQPAGFLPPDLYKPKIQTVGGLRADEVLLNDEPPQEWLDKKFVERGYSISNFSSLETAYYCKPTEYQQASYGLKVVNMCRKADLEGLSKVMDCGLSLNPCNRFGESLLHMACRRGDFEQVQFLVSRGCSVQICDDFGRTPLHDACWTTEPNFRIVELLLDIDCRLLHIVDCRGAAPLAYVKRENWEKWKRFFLSKVEIYWAHRDVSTLGDEPPPPLTRGAPNSRSLSENADRLPVDVVSKLAAGKIEPDDASVKVEKKEAVPSC